MKCSRDVEISPIAPDPFITTEDAQAFLNVSGDATLIAAFVQAASDQIENYCNALLFERTVTEVVRLPETAETFILAHKDVSEIAGIDYEGEAIDTTALRLAKSPGLVRWRDGSEFSPGLYELEYTAGVPVADLPSPIVQATKELIRDMYANKGRASNVSRENVPDVGDVTYSDASMVAGPNGVSVPVTVAALLGPYVTRYSL